MSAALDSIFFSNSSSSFSHAGYKHLAWIFFFSKRLICSSTEKSDSNNFVLRVSYILVKNCIIVFKEHCERFYNRWKNYWSGTLPTSTNLAIGYLPWDSKHLQLMASASLVINFCPWHSHIFAGNATHMPKIFHVGYFSLNPSGQKLDILLTANLNYPPHLCCASAGCFEVGLMHQK